MALSATGRTLRIRRQMPSYADSPMSEDMEDGQGARAGGGVKLKRLKLAGSKLAVRIQLDGPVDSFTGAAVVSATSDLIPDEEEDEALSSDDEIFKDVRAYVRQTLGKPALQKAESGICGGGDEPPQMDQSRTVTPWLEGGNYVTVRHPAPDAPIDTPPLPGSEDGLARRVIYPSGLTYQLPLTCRHWFDPRWVSDVERAELTTFGVSESTYRNLRDKLIDAYNTDPSKFLSVRNAREATGFVEVGVLTKVWGFLDYWGIINFFADPSTAPRFSKKLIDFPIGRPQDPLPELLCSSCHQPCMFVAYALKAEAAPMVPREQIAVARFCAPCINTGNYPPFFSKAAFEMIDVMLPGSTTEDFSEEDTMRMLEAIDRYGTDWESVATMVGGGKTAAQCLLHFAQIPISDKFPAPAEIRVKPKLNPFRDESNELLNVMSLIATTVPCAVAAQVANL